MDSQNLIKDYKFDGIRIDSMVNVPKSFWDKFAAASGVFQIGDVFNANPDYVAEYQLHCDSVLNYPFYYSMESAFKKNNMREIESYWFLTRYKFPNAQTLGVFFKNYNNPRFLHRINDKNKLMNAVVLTLTWEGILVFYYGGEQFFNGGQVPENREEL